MMSKIFSCNSNDICPLGIKACERFKLDVSDISTYISADGVVYCGDPYIKVFCEHEELCKYVWELSMKASETG